MDDTDLAESLTLSFLRSLETLTATEQITFLLHDVLDRPLREVAQVVNQSVQACDEMAERARLLVAAGYRAGPTPQ